MPIRVKREPEDWGPGLEHCAFCWQPTPFWYWGKDVAVCPPCAKKVKPEDVPTKNAWWNQTKGLHQ